MTDRQDPWPLLIASSPTGIKQGELLIFYGKPRLKFPEIRYVNLEMISAYMRERIKKGLG